MVQSALWSAVVFGFLSSTTQGGDQLEGAPNMDSEDVGSASSLVIHQFCDLGQASLVLSFLSCKMGVL